jgi:hypothetical protein
MDFQRGVMNGSSGDQLLAVTINGWSAVGFWARMGWEACFTLFFRGSFSVFAVRVSITAQHFKQAV